MPLYLPSYHQRELRVENSPDPAEVMAAIQHGDTEHKGESMKMKKSAERKAGIALAVCLVAVGGCHHIEPEPQRTGRSSFRFVEERAPAGPTTANVTAEEPKSGDYFQEARPIAPLTTPIFPPKALMAKAGFTTVGVRIEVSKEGRVTNVGPSLAAISIPGRFDEEFQEAVRTAVRQWQFRPAQRYHVEVSKNAAGEVEFHQTSREDTETYFDVSFTFTADGKVMSEAAKGK